MDINTTIGKGCEDWLYRCKAKAVKGGTFTRLMTAWKMMRRYQIFDVKLCDLQTSDIQYYVNKLASDGYAVTTIKKQFNLLSGYLRYLIGEAVPIRPAYLNVKLPVESGVIRKRKDIVAYTVPEQKKLVSVCGQHQIPGASAVILMMEMGLRIGEVLGLYWEDILWDRRAIHIHRTAVNHNSRRSQYIQDSPKSKASDRIIPLSNKAYCALEELANNASELTGLVFSVDGETVGYPTLRTQISQLCKEAGVKYYGMHVFRHTFATNCYYKGVDIKRLSQFLGHSSVTVTYNTYVHLYGDNLEELRCVVS